MTTNNQDRILKRKHDLLLCNWIQKKGPCIICGENEGTSSDHLPPKVLYPKSLQNVNTALFTYPVCDKCNKDSREEDLILSVIMSFYVNQDSIINNQDPTDPDLLVLYNQTKSRLDNPTETERLQSLLGDYTGKDPKTGRDAINISKLSTNKTLTKIVKSIYWTNTGGDILQKYNPGWWISPFVDTSKPMFIEKHLKVSSADIFWENRFISHFSIGQPGSGADGFISCSLHFYTEGKVGKGMNFHLIASPVKTIINGVSMYECCTSLWGEATIKPQI